MSPPISLSLPRAFTLLELLVVIAIIGILAGIMFPAAIGALQKAERAHAEQTVSNLKIAVSAYFTEYRKYPVPLSTNEGDEIRSNRNLMDVLLGSDGAKEQGGLNPQGTAFFTDRVARSMGDGKYRKGIKLETDGGGELWDPYGEFYYVRMDLDHNNRTEKPTWDDREGEVLPQSILVWCAGKDTLESQAKDNITSW